MKFRILILLASSVVFCTGNAMAPTDENVAATIALLPQPYSIPVPQNTTIWSLENSSLITPEIQREMLQLISTLYCEQHFERLKELKKQRHKKF